MKYSFIILTVLTFLLMSHASSAGTTEANHLAKDISVSLWAGNPIADKQIEDLLHEISPTEVLEDKSARERGDTSSTSSSTHSTESTDEVGNSLKTIAAQYASPKKVLEGIDAFIAQLHKFAHLVDSETFEVALGLIINYAI